MQAEKSGMVVNANKEVIGWVNAGEEVDLREGDTLVTHHKTAEKMGLGEQFKAEKAANAPAKTSKTEGAEGTEGGEKPKRTRSAPVAIPEDATYTVKNADFKAAKEEGARGDVFRVLVNNTCVKDYLAIAKDGYSHTKKDGTVVKFDGMTCLRYAMKRGVISIDPV